MFAMNDTPLTTGTANTGTVASVVTQRGVDGTVQNGAARATGVVTATLCSQMDSAQAAEAASLVACAATEMNGDTDMNDGVADVADAADAANATVIGIGPNTQQQKHTGVSCMAASREAASATLKGAVGITDGTPAIVKHVRLAGAAAMAAVASTGPMETGDVPADVSAEVLRECCMSVPMRTGEVPTDAVEDGDDTSDTAVLDEEVIYQLRQAGTPGRFLDLEEVDDAVDDDDDDGTVTVARQLQSELTQLEAAQSMQLMQLGLRQSTLKQTQLMLTLSRLKR